MSNKSNDELASEQMQAIIEFVLYGIVWTCSNGWKLIGATVEFGKKMNAQRRARLEVTARTGHVAEEDESYINMLLEDARWMDANE